MPKTILNLIGAIVFVLAYWLAVKFLPWQLVYAGIAVAGWFVMGNNAPEKWKK